MGFRNIIIYIGVAPKVPALSLFRRYFYMKVTRNTVKSKIMKTIVSKSVKAAEQNANSACLWFFNQPEPPKDLKKLRKF
ncbi:cyclic lactone autoinducer peptide [Ruminococcus flavefaciens]|nr:cyclic lactone autoinducer peptide [Ruminococcus flavefaciens]